MRAGLLVSFLVEMFFLVISDDKNVKSVESEINLEETPYNTNHLQTNLDCQDTYRVGIQIFNFLYVVLFYFFVISIHKRSLNEAKE